MDSAAAVLKFKVNYEQTKHLAIGNAVHSDEISAGGHTWRINCYPRGNATFGNGEHLAIFVELMSKSRIVKAAIEVVLMDKGRETSSNAAKCLAGVHLFQMNDDSFGWSMFVRKTDLVKDYVTNGQIAFITRRNNLVPSYININAADAIHQISRYYGDCAN
ncbi:hypothetical protein EJB05_48141, partial [Eragrostis curvula]